MDIVKIEQKTLEEMTGLPEVVYKYRDWNNNFHKKIITNREVFFAAPTSFEDPLDCKLDIDYGSLSNKDIFNFYVYLSKRNNPDKSRSEHRKFAREWLKKTPMRDPEYVRKAKEDIFKEYNSHIGILSLTANSRKKEMWNKYAGNHKGFAVGFNPQIMFKQFGGGGKVEYYDELPPIFPCPKHSYEQQHFLQVFSKLSKWSFEEEYRTHIFRSNELTKESRTIQLPPEAFTEIVIGADMPDDQVEELLSSIPPELMHITIKQANKNKMS